MIDAKVGEKESMYDVEEVPEDECSIEEIPEVYRNDDPLRPLKYLDLKGNVYTYFLNPMWKVVVFILMLECLERFAYYCLQPEYNRYLTNPVFAGYDVAQASQTIKTMSGLGYMFPILSAIVADSYLGVYKSILVTSLIYLGALVFFTCSGSPSLYAEWMTPLYFYFWFPLGFGGIKSLVNVMGANQFHPVYKAKENFASYYLLFYSVINCGALVSTAVNVYANTIGDEMWKAFLIPTITFAVGLLLFSLGSKRFVKRAPLGSTIAELGKVVCSSLTSCPPSLEKQKVINGGKFDTSFVNEAKQMLGLLPLLFSATFFFMMAYWQNDTYVLYQGYEMAPTWGIDSNVLNSFMNPVSVIFFALLMERLVYPQLGKRGIYLNHMVRFQLGCFCGILAMMYAMMIDLILKQSWSPNREENLSILAQAPIYALIAFGEVLANPSSLELAYYLAPDSLKSTSAGIHSLMSGMIPNFLSAAVLSALSGFQVDSQGCGSRLDDDCDGVWDYKTVQFDKMFIVFAAFPVVGIIVLQLLKPAYYRAIALKKEQAEEQNTQK